MIASAPPGPPAPSPGGPRVNREELATIAVLGRVTPPLSKGSPYRIGQDGVARVLPGPGGITLSHRIGDRCVGIAADHLEPAVSIRATGKTEGPVPDAANRGLNLLACVGNAARVVSGPAAGAKGLVTGKHGGVGHVIVDFPREPMRRMRVGDMVQIAATGQGLRLPNFPEVAAMNADPGLIARMGILVEGGRLLVPVTHLVPAALMGSGLGRGSASLGDCDIQLFDHEAVERFRLGSLRFGDIVAILDTEGRHGRSYARRHVTIGVVVHSDSTVSGHGPGVTALLSGPAGRLRPRHDPNANLAVLYGVRPAAAPRVEPTFTRRTRPLAPPSGRALRTGRRADVHP
ncbi:DUF4438 domain-containing protein [Amaricoccus solimangrovi]|uniref:DUF4438 domain-containing protein n=1 Tax=Amaricoccus solimangrovi TaxID=2589815 RepID=A0A501WY98_9RHOB|nr:DUF4438 domain-containing protein [Amaricoccus solimangrovi]TPE53245.1 DUF4438 domain-containing protein [Amaricoccus solimangrovi]